MANRAQLLPGTPGGSPAAPQRYLVLPFDDALARRWAEMCVKFKRTGRGITDADAWIAATALLHQVPLATHNRKHFEHIPGLTLISFAPH